MHTVQTHHAYHTHYTHRTHKTHPQDEYNMTKVQWLLYRPFIHALIAEVTNPTRSLIKLDGPAGVC